MGGVGRLRVFPIAEEVQMIGTGTTPATTFDSQPSRTPVITRIAVGVDGYPEGQDAVFLAAGLAAATGASLLLVAVHPDFMIVLPQGFDRKSLDRDTERILWETRDSLAPSAMIQAETDFSVPRALLRVVQHDRRDLLVVGSSRTAPDGHVRIGKRTRQLLSQIGCPLAVAPRGMRDRPSGPPRTIGVGYDGSPESEAALAFARSLAASCSATVTLRAVVDDRVPILIRSSLSGFVKVHWSDTIETERERLQHLIDALPNAGDGGIRAEVVTGRPADVLLALSSDVDLLLIGSRRWGMASRVLLGSTGAAVLHEASCPVLAVPRPAE